MRTKLMSIALLSAAVAAPAFHESPAPDSRWQDDPACRMVFFATLEGLYTDGIATEVVDLIVPRGDDSIQRSFVLQCPLCHPVYEAFRLYQSRQPFAMDPDKTDTFGRAKPDPELLKALRSEDVYTRIRAMGGLVRPWIEKRLAMMRLTEAETKEWKDRLLKRVEEGDRQFKKLKQTEGTVYSKHWLFYDGCQACKAVEGAVKK